MPEAPPSPIRAGTINLARMLPETHSRAKAIAAEIDSMRLDLIGFQETEEWIEDDLVIRLAGDWKVGSDHINCPTMYRADVFERAAWNGQTSLKITMPGTVRSRYGSAALLKRKSDGLIFVFATIHPSNTGEFPGTGAARLKLANLNRQRQAESCWQQLEQWGVTHFPLIIVGDMNDATMASTGLPGVFVKHGMTGVLQALGQPGRIDRAFVKGFTVDKATVNPVSDKVSDHDFGRFVVTPIPPPPPPPLHGVDVSSHQGADWIPAKGDTFALIKASEGTTYTSPVRWSQVSAARAAGLIVGHYHYMWPGNAVEQARFFVANAGAQPGELLCLDWEMTAGGHPTVDEAAEFIAEVQRLAPDHRVLLYCNQSDWVSTAVKAPDGLWIAHYGVDEPKTTSPYIFHQYTDDPIDKNRSSFTKVDDLKAWANAV